MMGAQNFDTVAEVQVLTTNYQAEFGRASAGQLRLVTKSGTQSFRGNVFWSHQNDALDANTWTRKQAGLEKSPHTYNAYGFTLGGPIYIPGHVQHQQVRSCSSSGARNGSAIARWKSRPASCRPPRCATATSARCCPARVIRDPLTGQPFQGNIIPQDRISPQGRALLNAFPLPIPGFQQGANNWIGNPAVFNNQRKDSIKIDFVPIAESSPRRPAHVGAERLERSRAADACTRRSGIIPGRTLAATLTSTLSQLAHQRVLVLVGIDRARRSSSGSATATTAPAAPTRCSIRRQSRRRHQLSVSVPGHEARSGQDSEHLAAGLHRDQQRRVSGILERLRVPVGRQRHEGHRQPHVQGRHERRAVGHERPHPAQLRARRRRPRTRTARSGSSTTRAGRHAAIRPSNALLGLFDDYTEFGNKPHTQVAGDGVRLRTPGQLEADPRSDARARPALFAVAAVGHDEQRDGVVRQSQFYNPATAAVDRSRRRLRRRAAIASTASSCPATRPPTRRSQTFPQLANLQRLYHGVPNGFAETPKDGLQPRLGLAYAINETTTFRAGVGRFLNRVQINTTAAYGFNPPLSEMQTVINGNVDAPGGASTRNFPLVMAMHSPDFTNPRSWAWNATLDRELPWTMRGTLSYVGRSASNLERARNINQLQPGTIQANPGVNANALRPYLGFGTHHAVRDDRQVALQRLQTQVERRSARGVGFSVAYTFSRTKDDGSRPQRPAAERLRRQRLLRHLGSRSAARAGVAGPLPLPDARVLGGAAAMGARKLGHRRASSRRSRARRSTCAPPVDIAGVGPGSGNQFYDLVGDPEAARGPIGIDTLVASDLVRQERVPGPGGRHVRHDAGEEHPAAARVLGPQHVVPQGLRGCGGRSASSSGSRCSTSSTAPGSETR